MELISPTDFAIDFARDRVQAVQDYALLAARSIANLFRRPLYVADMIQQADLIGVGSLPIVVLTIGDMEERLRKVAALETQNLKTTGREL